MVVFRTFWRRIAVLLLDTLRFAFLRVPIDHSFSLYVLVTMIEHSDSGVTIQVRLLLPFLIAAVGVRLLLLDCILFLILDYIISGVLDVHLPCQSKPAFVSDEALFVGYSENRYDRAYEIKQPNV